MTWGVCSGAGSGGRPSGPRTEAATSFCFSKKAASPFSSPDFFTSTSCFFPASPSWRTSSFGEALLPTLNSATTSPWVMVLSWGYDLRVSRFQYGFPAISPAGIVTGSSYVFGSRAPGGGFLNCGLRGIPEDRVESTAKIFWMTRPNPVGSIVYF